MKSHKKSHKKPSLSYRDEMHQEYLELKWMYREIRRFTKMLAEIRETVQRMLATLEESNKKSAIFWVEFKRDFPEVQLDEIAWRNVVYGYNSARVTPDTVAGDNQRFEVVEAKAAS